MKTLLGIMLALAFLAVLDLSAVAQASNPPSLPESAGIDPQKEDMITAVPNRPTFSTTAETVQTGIFEVECGLEAARGHQNINGLLKFGLTKNLELRFVNLRHRWRDGTSYVIFDPMDLLGKLAALVSQPRFNLVRYHGILAPSAR